jgi:hypothetical protein
LYQKFRKIENKIFLHLKIRQGVSLSIISVEKKIVAENLHMVYQTPNKRLTSLRLDIFCLINYYKPIYFTAFFFPPLHQCPNQQHFCDQGFRASLDYTQPIY